MKLLGSMVQVMCLYCGLLRLGLRMSLSNVHHILSKAGPYSNALDPPMNKPWNRIILQATLKMGYLWELSPGE
jgi:hypothetical protein